MRILVIDEFIGFSRRYLSIEETSFSGFPKKFIIFYNIFICIFCLFGNRQNIQIMKKTTNPCYIMFKHGHIIYSRVKTRPTLLFTLYLSNYQFKKILNLRNYCCPAHSLASKNSNTFTSTSISTL